MKQPEKAAPKAESHRARLLGLVTQRRVVDLQLTQRLPQVIVPVAVRGEQAAVHHRGRHGVSVQRRRRRFLDARDCISDPRIRDGFDVTDEVPNLARAQRLHRHLVRAHDPHLLDVIRGARVHQFDLVPDAHRPVDNPKHAHDAAVNVKVRVEDERAQGFVRGVRRRRHELHDLLQDVLHADVRLRRRLHRAAAVQPQDILDLAAHPVGLGAREVNLVEDRDDLEVVIEREVDVGDRLRLHALRRVHHEQRALARG